MQVFKEDDIDDVVDMGVEADIGGGEVDFFALAGEGGAIDLIAVGGEEVVDFAEGPSAAPGAVDEDDDLLGVGRAVVADGAGGSAAED